MDTLQILLINESLNYKKPSDRLSLSKVLYNLHINFISFSNYTEQNAFILLLITSWSCQTPVTATNSNLLFIYFKAILLSK